MKILLAAIIGIHGLIHLMGFIKAFNFAELNQLTRPITRVSGILWLMASILFMTALVMFLLSNGYWWLPGSTAAALSQVLIIQSWHDARSGSIANAVILIAAIAALGSWSFYNRYIDDVKQSIKQGSCREESMLTEDDIKHLPAPVQKYIRYTGSVGKPKVCNFKIEFTGRIRKNEASEWMPFTSQQFNFMEPPARLFFMKAVMKHLPVEGYHRFYNGKAFMDIRLFSLFRVQYMEGGDMDMAETVTFFNDMCCMAPATLIDKRIKWIETRGNKVNASFTNNGITISAWLYFNNRGELVNFISSDRYAADAGRKLPWSSPLKEYREINGYRLLNYAEAVYSYPDRELCYGTFNLTGIEYNIKKDNVNDFKQ